MALSISSVYTFHILFPNLRNNTSGKTNKLTLLQFIKCKSTFTIVQQTVYAINEIFFYFTPMKPYGIYCLR